MTFGAYYMWSSACAYATLFTLYLHLSPKDDTADTGMSSGLRCPLPTIPSCCAYERVRPTLRISPLPKPQIPRTRTIAIPGSNLAHGYSTSTIHPSDDFDGSTKRMWSGPPPLHTLLALSPALFANLHKSARLWKLSLVVFFVAGRAALSIDPQPKCDSG